MLEEIEIKELENRYLKQKENFENKGMILNRELFAMRAIWEKIKPKNAMEIGIRKGYTAQFLMENSPWLEKYIGIDVPSSYRTDLEEQQKEVYAEKGIYIKDKSILDLRILANGSYDLRTGDLPELDFIFIDGNHSLKGVLNDSILAFTNLAEGGVIFWHDYKNVETVTEAICFLKYKFGWNIKYIKETFLCYFIKNG